MGLLPWEQGAREVIVKMEEETTDKYGISPFEQPIERLLETGLVNLNKPAGPTSHLATEYVKNILGLKKAGHGGTLDPGVTGVLPIALQRSTRIVQTWLKYGKEYVVRMHTHKLVPESTLRALLKKYIGKIDQLPPVKSAVKRVVRQRRIYYLELNEIKSRDILFTVGCQAGTYIRKLVHDMGLECGGAHMAELIRTKAGPFTHNDWCTLQDLEDAMAFYKEENNEKFLRGIIRPVEAGVEHIPSLWASDNAIDALCHGATLKVPGVIRLHNAIVPGEIVAVKTLKGELVLIGTAMLSSDEILRAERGVAVKTVAVIMKPGVYPKR